MHQKQNLITQQQQSPKMPAAQKQSKRKHSEMLQENKENIIKPNDNGQAKMDTMPEEAKRRQPNSLFRPWCDEQKVDETAKLNQNSSSTSSNIKPADKEASTSAAAPNVKYQSKISLPASPVLISPYQQVTLQKQPTQQVQQQLLPQQLQQQQIQQHHMQQQQQHHHQHTALAMQQAIMYQRQQQMIMAQLWAHQHQQQQQQQYNHQQHLMYMQQQLKQQLVAYGQKQQQQHIMQQQLQQNSNI